MSKIEGVQRTYMLMNYLKDQQMKPKRDNAKEKMTDLVGQTFSDILHNAINNK